MTKKKMIKRTYIPLQAPIGATIVTWLFYKQLNPKEAWKGVVLTLFIGWIIIIWLLFIAQLFMYDFVDPVLKDKE